MAQRNPHEETSKKYAGGYTVTTGQPGPAPVEKRSYSQPVGGHGLGPPRLSSSAMVADSLLGSLAPSKSGQQAGLEAVSGDSLQALSDLPFDLGVLLEGNYRDYAASAGCVPKSNQDFKDWLISAEGKDFIALDSDLMGVQSASASVAPQIGEDLSEQGAVQVEDELAEQPAPQQERRGKRKTGRPLSFTGDPNSPSLTESERRKIRRRIANRESARRIRNKQQEKTEELLEQIRALQASQATLKARTEHAEQDKSQLAQQVQALSHRASASALENEQLRHEAQSLRQAYETNLSVLENTLSKQDSELEQQQAMFTPFAAMQPEPSSKPQSQPYNFPSQGSLDDTILDLAFDIQLPHFPKGFDPANMMSSMDLDPPNKTESAEFIASALRNDSTGPG